MGNRIGNYSIKCNIKTDNPLDSSVYHTIHWMHLKPTFICFSLGCNSNYYVNQSILYWLVHGFWNNLILIKARDWFQNKTNATRQTKRIITTKLSYQQQITACVKLNYVFYWKSSFSGFIFNHNLPIYCILHICILNWHPSLKNKWIIFASFLVALRSQLAYRKQRDASTVSSVAAVFRSPDVIP